MFKNAPKYLSLLLLVPSFVRADYAADLRATAKYEHNKKWLANTASPFVASNIRGQELQYAERRQAALDIVKQQRDFGVVTELMHALEDKSFMSDQIIDILIDWKAKRALPLLKQVAQDSSRPKEIQEKARTAADLIARAKSDKPPVFTDKTSN